MHFSITLRQVQSFPALQFHYEEELDDVRSIINSVCESLAETSSADFVVSGFGQDRWPVDVRTDLPIFLEQLPNAIAAVESNASFLLDFYEQGIERVVCFEPQGDHYFARCESQAEWRPDPAIESISRLELRRMLSDVRESFMQFLSRNAPRVATHPWMREWAGAARRGDE